MEYMGKVEYFSLNDIDREEPTDFPPQVVETYPTECTDLTLWMLEYFEEEFFGDAEEVQGSINDPSWKRGADGAMYREEDGDLVRYSFRKMS